MSLRKTTVKPAFLLVVVLLTLVSCSEAAEPPAGSSSVAQVSVWFSKIANATCSAQDWRDIQRFADRAKSPEDRVRGAVAMARFDRVTLGNPQLAIRLLGPMVLAAQSASAKPMDKVGGKASVDPYEIESISKPEHWIQDKVYLPAILEIARSFADLKDSARAIGILTACKAGLATELSSQALAAETAGDCFMAMGRYSQAVEMYEFVRAAIEKLSKPYDQLTDDLRIISAGILGKVNQAKRKLDEEKYGLSFVLYREADKLRRIDNQPVKAYIQFQKIIKDFPNTVYSEAATAYSIECLFDCATGLKGDLVGRYIKGITARLAEMSQSLDDIARMGATDEAKKRHLALIAEEKAMLDIAQSLPDTGDRAAARALKAANDFIGKNQYGLYRGEVMIAVGDYFFAGVYRSRDAVDWYSKAVFWHDAVAKIEARADSFSVEDRVKAVSAPPPDMKITDDWGNVLWSKIEPGMLINHRTCAWYCARQKMDAKMKRAACLFDVGNVNAAADDLPYILDVDKAEKTMHDRGMPNTYDRLVNGMRSGRMMATKVELSLFKGEARTALIAAELAYEVEDWKNARELYAALYEKFSSRINQDALMYCKYMLGQTALMCSFDYKDGKPYWDEVAAHRDCPTWSRAMMALFNSVQSSPGKQKEAIGYLDRIIEAMPVTPEGRRAKFIKGEYLLFNHEVKDARDIFLSLVKIKDCESWILIACNHFIDNIAKQNS